MSSFHRQKDSVDIPLCSTISSRLRFCIMSRSDSSSRTVGQRALHYHSGSYQKCRRVNALLAEVALFRRCIIDPEQWTVFAFINVDSDPFCKNTTTRKICYEEKNAETSQVSAYLGNQAFRVTIFRALRCNLEKFCRCTVPVLFKIYKTCFWFALGSQLFKTSNKLHCLDFW